MEITKQELNMLAGAIETIRSAQQNAITAESNRQNSIMVSAYQNNLNHCEKLIGIVKQLESGESITLHVTK